MSDFKELVKNLYTSKNRELTEDKLKYIETTYGGGKEEDFVKNFYTTVGEDLPEEKFNYIKDTYLKKKEPATTSFVQGVSKELGLKPSTPFVQSDGQELPSKTAATTTQLDFTRPQPRLSAEEQQAQGMVTKQQKAEKALEFKEGVKQKLYDNNRYWLLQNKKEAQENGMTLKELQASRRKELANNYLDDSEQREANSILDHLDAKKSGDDKRAGEALKQYYAAKNEQRAKFQSDMQNLQAEYDNIASRIEGGELDADKGLQTLEAIQKRQKNLEISQKAFLKPKEALKNFVQENSTEIASVSKPTQTPYEQLEEYTNNLYAKVRQLKADLGYKDYGRDATLGGYAQDYAIRAEQDGGDLLDELYAEELKLKTATKLLLLNRTPIQADETALGVLGKSFGNSLAPNLQKEQGTAVTIANNVKEIVEDAKIGEKVYEEQKKFAEESAKPYETYSAKWFAEPVGASLAIVPEFIIGSLISEGALGVTKIGKLLTLAEKYGKIKGLNTTAKYVNAINKNAAGKVTGKLADTFIKAQANGLKFGATSEVVSKLFPSQEDELNFTTGYFGGVIGKGAELALSGAAKNLFKVFGNKGAEAAKKISELGGTLKLLKDAPKTVLGEVGEEFGESLGQIYKQSSSWKEVGEKIKEQYGTLDKATEFVVLTGIMALGMGAGNSIGANLFTASKEAYNELPREQRAIVDSILDQAKAGDKQVEETVAEDIKKDIAKDLTPAELKEIETTTEETDEQRGIEEPISAGTDVLETGVGMAAEPGKERVAGEDIQAEAVPQAPILEPSFPSINLAVPESPYNKSLRNLGYADADIEKMTIEQKQNIAENKIEAPVVESTAKVDSIKENAKQERIAEMQAELDKEQAPEVVSEKVTEVTAPAIEVTPTSEAKTTEAVKVEPAKETVKPTKKERKVIAEAKIDDLAAKAKEFLRNKNLPEGTQVSGVSQDKVIDILASTVKALVNSGIEISEAIKQVREFFEQDFDTSGIKDYQIAQAIARDELTDVAKDNGFSSYREAVFAVNKYVREVSKEDVITKEEITKAKEAKDKEAEAPKKGYTSKKKQAQEAEKGPTIKETGRSKSYAEGRVPVSEAYNDVVNAQKEYYEQMNQKATLEQAEEYLAQYGDSEQGLIDAYDDMMKAFRANPFLDARNAIAIELLADRMFARALDFQKAGQSDKYNRFLEKSEDLRKEAFKAHYKAGQFNSAVAVFSRSVNPDAFLAFIDGQAKEGLENFKKTKPNVYEKYEQEVKDFQGKVKDIKKAAAQQAVVSAPNSTTKVNVKVSDKLKARYEQGKARQAEALKKLGKINFFGSSGLSNEAIEAVGELVLAQFEQGIYKAATIIERIIEITDGKLNEKNIKDVYDAYKVNYKGEKLTLTELEEVLRKEEIAEKEPATDIDKALEKEREKLAKIKADYEQAVVDKADALVLKRAQQFVKDQEKKVKEQEDKAKKAATAKTAEGKRPTLSDLIQRELEADSTKEQIAKELVEKGGLSEREANKLAEIYYNKYRKILKEKITSQLLKDLTPKKVKQIEAQMNALDGKPFGKTLGGMIANQVAAGALDSESLRAAFASKYDIPSVSPIVAANIRALSAKVRAAKTTLGVNLANKNLLTYINSTVKTKKGSIISTLYYTSILSGISTAVVNTYGNVNNLINQATENFVQSIIEAKQGNKGNLASNAQVTAKIRKAVSNLVESFTSFIDIMAYGGGESRYSTMKKGTFGSFESEDLILKKKDLKDLGFKKAFTALAKLYKTAPAFFVRNLPASDEGFYMANFNMEATRELRKKLYSEGLRGEELEKKVYEQVYGTKDIKAQAINEAIQELKRIGINPSSRKLLVNRIAKEIILKKLDETVQNAANELAKENTFRGQPRGATGYLSQKIPQLWLVTPFVSTPFKMAEKMINYIPLYGAIRYYGGGITDTLRKISSVDAEFKRKGIEYAKKEGELRNKQLAQVLTGHLLALAFWGLSQIDWEDEDGKVVPFVDASAGYYGIEDKADREKLREALPEYTMRIGNLKFSYKTNPLLAMIALPFGVIKDSERAYEEMDFVDWGVVYNNEILTFLYESTPIKGLQEFFKNIGETFDIEGDDRTWEDFAQIPVKQAAALGANLAIDNLYKQMFDFYDPTKYVVQDNKEVLYKAFNMENIGGLQTDYDRWGREIKFYPGEAFFPIQYMFKDKTDKEITDWEIKNDITIPKTNRKTLVLNDRKLKTEKAIEKQKEELRKDYGIESDEYKLFEETLNADFKLLTYSEYQAYDKTVRSEIFNIIKTNFDNVTEEYKKLYKESVNDQQRDADIKPISKLSRPEAKKLVEILFETKRRDYINKNFTKIEQK